MSHSTLELIQAGITFGIFAAVVFPFLSGKVEHYAHRNQLINRNGQGKGRSKP